MKVERHGYRFTNKINTRGGIVATILSGLALLLFVFGVLFSYKKGGDAGLIVGGIGALSFLVATIGLITALKSFQENDKFYLFSWIGTIANGIVWMIMCAVIAFGIMA